MLACTLYVCICIHVYLGWLFLSDDRPGTHVVKYSGSAPRGLCLFRLDFRFISRLLVSFRPRRTFATSTTDSGDSTFSPRQAFRPVICRIFGILYLSRVPVSAIISYTFRFVQEAIRLAPFRAV